MCLSNEWHEITIDHHGLTVIPQSSSELSGLPPDPLESTDPQKLTKYETAILSLFRAEQLFLFFLPLFVIFPVIYPHIDLICKLDSTFCNRSSLICIALAL